MFDDFEHEPRPELWDRINSARDQENGPGRLALLFASFSHAPHRRVWRGIVRQMHPSQRMRAIAYWSTAAGIALLAGVLLWSRVLAPDSTVGTLVAELDLEPRERAVRDAEIGPAVTDQKDQGTNWTAFLEEFYQFQQEEEAVNPQTDAADRSPSHFAGDLKSGPDRENRSDRNRNFVAESTPAPLQNLDSALEEKALSSETDWIAAGLDSRIPDLMQLATSNAQPHFSYLAASGQGSDRAGRQTERSLSTQLGSNLSPTQALFPRSMEALEIDGDVTSQNLGSGITYSAEEDLAQSERESFQTPISFGVAFQWYLHPRISLLPGLNYSRLRSNVTGNVNADPTNIDVVREYLGPSLSLQYDLLQKKHYQVYANAGLHYDFGLRKQETVSSIDPDRSLAQSMGSESLGNQAAAQTGMGIRFNLGKRFGLYAQGSVANYFFQSERNLWSTRQFWPSAQAGLNIRL